MKRITASLLALCILFLSAAQMRADALASVFEHSDSYRASEFYSDLLAVNLTGDYRTDIVSVALSQVGYHEGKSAGDLSGSSSGKANFTEYGYNFGLPGDSWCASFVWWCARQVGVKESIIRKTEWAKISLQSFESRPLSQCGNIRVGDIAFFDMSGGDGIEDHVGIIVGVTANEIVTVEGNTSNAVRKQTYSRSTGMREDGAGKLLYIGSPDYHGKNTNSVNYETVFVSSPGAAFRPTVNGSKSGTLDDGEYMLLSADTSGQWLQIAAPNGIDSVFISAKNASLSVKDLPPITGYDAWSTYEASVSTTVPTDTVTAPVQTDPSVTTTAPTSASTEPTQAPTTPSTIPSVSDDPGNGYTSSFGTEWIEYAAYGLLGVLAIAFIIILASLMGRKNSPPDDYIR